MQGGHASGLHFLAPSTPITRTTGKRARTTGVAQEDNGDDGGVVFVYECK